MSKLWGWIVAAGVFLLGMMTMRDRKWQERAVSNEEDDIQNDLHQAEIANQQAKVHDQKAHEIKRDAETYKRNKRTNEILEKWRKG